MVHRRELLEEGFPTFNILIIQTSKVQLYYYNMQATTWL